MTSPVREGESFLSINDSMTLDVTPNVSMDTNITPNISMDTNSSFATDLPRKEIKLEMDHQNDDRTDDPLVRFRSVEDCLHKWSPLQGLLYLRLTAGHFYQVNNKIIKMTMLVIFLLLYIVYLGVAFSYSFGDEPSMRLLVVTLLIILGLLYHYIKIRYGKTIYRAAVKPVRNEVYRYRRFIRACLTVFVTLAVLAFILIDTTLRRPASLISIAGILIFVSLMFFFSHDPRQVIWRPVLWGLLLQLVFALIVLRSRWGYDLFIWLGDRVKEYLSYSTQSSEFIFGQNFRDHFFAFSVLPVIIFFSSSISILYYLGVIQLLIEKIAFVMEFTLGTGAMESLHAALNIFVGWGEAVALVKPLLDNMSMSELHTVMTNGFATVAGSTLALYMMYGAPANHLLSASVMSAPAALAMSKLFYPEKPENRHKKQAQCKIEKQGSGIIDAASAGAVGAIGIVSYILASVIAFVALLGFVNATLQWFGERVGLAPPDYPVLSFQLICSYVFWPVVFLMGVAPQDCFIVGRIVGMKTFVNEILAYEDLGRVMKNRVKYLNWTMTLNGTADWMVDGSGNLRLPTSNVTLMGGVISDHSAMVATYALCGFSNILALGIMIGALTAAAPNRKDDIVRVSIRALISGSMGCFLTACIAGLLGDS